MYLWFLDHGGFTDTSNSNHLLFQCLVARLGRGKRSGSCSWGEEGLEMKNWERRASTTPSLRLLLVCGILNYFRES